MDDTSGYMRIISGQARSLPSAAARLGLSGLASGYANLMRFRNFYYDYVKQPKFLPAPVFSVGNLTVGGTGKTPMCIWLCEELLRRDLKPAVLSRGYKSREGGMADELIMLSRRCPEAVAIANPDRMAAGEMAIKEFGAQAVILDDAFQHRRIDRDLDIVLVDATQPFGYEHVLPRGLLREPMGGLRRADVVILTRCNQADGSSIAETTRRIQALKPDVPVLRAHHRPHGFFGLNGESMSAPSGRRIGCLAGIARPQALGQTLLDMDLPLVAILGLADHHVYRSLDLPVFEQWIEEEGLDAIVTTEKDAVKLAELGWDAPVPISVLRVAIDFVDDDERATGELIDETLRSHRAFTAEMKELLEQAGAMPSSSNEDTDE